MNLLGTGSQRAAKNSRVAVGGQALAYSKYDATFDGGDIDTVNFESADDAGDSWDEGIISVLGATFSFGGNWDASAAAFADPPGLYPRDDLENLEFYLNVADDILWTFPYSRILSAKNGASVREAVTFEVSSGKSQGPFDYPDSDA